MRKIEIQTGERFGSVIALATKTGHQRHTIVHCLCDCGNTFGATGTRLRSGKVVKCPPCNRPILASEERKIRQRESSYRHAANRRGYEWQIDRDSFRKLLESPCYYCGIAPAGGIDRKNNSIGYTLINSVACCADCNYAKLNKSEPQFIAWVLRLARHQGFSL